MHTHAHQQESLLKLFLKKLNVSYEDFWGKTAKMSEKEVQSSPDDGDSFLETFTNYAPDGWRHKVAKMCLQLTLGAEKAAALYSDARERLDHIEGRSLVSRRLAEVVANQAVKDPEIVERAKARFLGDLARKQENLEAVISSAVVQLPALPAPSIELAAHPGTPDGVEAQPSDLSEENTNPLNPDWAATFSSFAENASTEELRRRLSKILAGEMQAPGAYPRSTLRALAELDQTDLLAMQTMLPYVLGKEILIFSDKDRDPSIESLLPLVDGGLIADANPGLNKTWSSPEGQNSLVIRGSSDWGLVLKIKQRHDVRLDVVPLTRTGLAVVELIGRTDERNLLKRMANFISKENIISIHLSQLEGKIFTAIEQLHPPALELEINTANIQF